MLYQLSYFRLFFLVWKASLSIADAKVQQFSELPKHFADFFKKNIVFCLQDKRKDGYTLLYIKLTEHLLVMPGHYNMVVADGVVEKIGSLLVMEL